jgi:hypothetical protein
MEKIFSIICFFIQYAKVNKQFGEKNFFLHLFVIFNFHLNYSGSRSMPQSL